MKIFQIIIFIGFSLTMLFSYGCATPEEKYDMLDASLIKDVNRRNLTHHVFDTPVTIRMKDVTLPQFFKELSKTVPISVIMGGYAAQTVISVSAKDEPLRDVLVRIGVEYSLIFYLNDVPMFHVFKVYAEREIYLKDFK